MAQPCCAAVIHSVFKYSHPKDVSPELRHSWSLRGCHRNGSIDIRCTFVEKADRHGLFGLFIFLSFCHICYYQCQE